MLDVKNNKFVGVAKAIIVYFDDFDEMMIF